MKRARVRVDVGLIKGNSWRHGIFALSCLCAMQPAARSAPIGEEDVRGVKLDPVQLKVGATKVLKTYCVSCHGPEKQKGKIRFDVLESIDAVDRQALFAQVQTSTKLTQH